MTDVLAPPRVDPPGAEPARPGSRAPWVAAVAAAAWSALAGLSLLTAPVLLTWLLEGSEQSLASPVRLGADVWLVAQGVPLELPSASLTLAPLGLTIPVLVLVHGAGRWAAATSGVPGARAAVRLVLGLTVAYAVAGAGVAAAAGTSEQYADPHTAALAAALVALLAGGSGVLVESGLAAEAWARLPGPFRTWLRAGAASAAALVAGGGALVVLSLVWHAGAVGRLTASLETGLVPALLLTVLGAALLPNAAVWAASFAVGPGFAVGAGTSVAPDSVELGPLPALPVLAGLPSSSPVLLGWLVLAVPLAAGCVAAVVVRQPAEDLLDPTPPPLPDRLLGVVAASVLAGGALGLLALLSGGSAGPGRLGVVGPLPLEVALAAAAEVAVAGLLASLVLALPWPRAAAPARSAWHRIRRREPDS